MTNRPRHGITRSFGLAPGLTCHPMLVHPGATIQTGLQEAPGSGGTVGLTAINLANALFRGVGEVVLQDNPWSGVVFVIAILVNSRVSFAFRCWARRSAA